MWLEELLMTRYMIHVKKQLFYASSTVMWDIYNLYECKTIYKEDIVKLFV